MRLQEIAEKLGFPTKAQGRTFGGHACPSCGTGGDHSNRLCLFIGNDDKERWKCQVCGTRGDTADFIAMATGCSVVEALKRLKTDAVFAQMTPAARTTTTKVHTAKMTPQHIKAMQAKMLTQPDDVVMKYMTNRGISPRTIEKLVKVNTLRFLPSNSERARSLITSALGSEKELEACGLTSLGKKWPSAAFRPIVGFLPTDCAIEFRKIDGKTDFPKAIRYGTTDYPFFYKNGKDVIVVEGLFDMLSLIEMGDSRSIMALTGANSWKPQWFNSIKKKGEFKHIYLGLDNDNAGKMCNASIAETLTEIELPYSLDSPGGNTNSKVKDWNDLLIVNRSSKTTTSV